MPVRIRLSWNDTNGAEDGYIVYRADEPMDVDDLPEPLATLPADSVEYIDEDVTESETYFYRVAASGASIVKLSAEVEIVAEVLSITPPDVGEYWDAQHGYYGGVVTHAASGRSWHLVVAEKSAEFDAVWKTTASTTAGLTGKVNALEFTDAILAAGALDHPAAAQCRAYSAGGHPDWSLMSTAELWVIYGSVLNPSTSTLDLWKTGGAQAFGNVDYWTSSQATVTSNAYYGRANSGSFPQTAKNVVKRCRPVRLVPIET